MSKTIALLVTLDTKDQEASYLIEQVTSRGHKAVLLDIGVVGQPGIDADISRGEIIAAGGGNLEILCKRCHTAFLKLWCQQLLLEIPLVLLA